MSEGFKVSKDNIRKVEDYLRAGTLEKGAVSVAMTTIARDVGMSSATVFRAINALKARGLVTVAPVRRPGFPQTITYLPAGHDETDDSILRAKLVKVRMALIELEGELDKMAEKNRALHDEVDTYRGQNARVESRAELEDGRVVLIIRPLPAAVEDDNA